ncbi:MAG: Mu P family protein [Burkholderiales bacterium]|nr:Mu P family protein [Burkholderiales bacterium]
MQVTPDQTVVVLGKAIPPDDVALIVNDVEWRGWSDVRITRGIERVPNDFEVQVTELYPGADSGPVQIDIAPGQRCEVWIGSQRVITGYVDRYSPAITRGAHTVTISGRGACQDLVDCAAQWPNQQISSASVLDVAQKLAEPYGVPVRGVTGPAVGIQGSLIPIINLMLGETAWEVIERLCRIAGILAFEQPDGSLLLADNPADPLTGAAATGLRSAASGFTEVVNVQAARATLSADQRYSEYRIYWYAYAPTQDIITEPKNRIATVQDVEARPGRLKILVAETGNALSEQIAKRRVTWELARRWGRSQMVTITTDSWFDSAGKLYEPNTVARLNLPSLKITGADKDWMISQVTYHKNDAGTTCDLVLMPPAAFSVQPALPPYVIPQDVAQAAAAARAQ